MGILIPLGVWVVYSVMFGWLILTEGLRRIGEKFKEKVVVLLSMLFKEHQGFK